MLCFLYRVVRQYLVSFDCCHCSSISPIGLLTNWNICRFILTELADRFWDMFTILVHVSDGSDWW